MTYPGVDKRALQILFSTFWSPSGWKRDHSTTPEDFAYAKSAGLMFEPMLLTHDAKVSWALNARECVSKTDVTNAFLASLTSRRLEWRSALGSLAVSLNLPTHSWSRPEGSSFQCSTCGIYESDGQENLNVLNFERFKWGGVRHTNPLYIGFDLEQFLREHPPKPTDADVELMRNILSTTRSLPRDARLSDLVKALAPIFSSNSNERRTLIGILGYCGILQDPSKPGFTDSFPACSNRPEVPWTKNDWPYPVQWWNASCGVSDESVAFWFPQL